MTPDTKKIAEEMREFVRRTGYQQPLNWADELDPPPMGIEDAIAVIGLYTDTHTGRFANAARTLRAHYEAQQAAHKQSGELVTEVTEGEKDAIRVAVNLITEGIEIAPRSFVHTQLKRLLARCKVRP